MEEFLKEKHAENYMGLDDDMPDAFDEWLLDLDVNEWIMYADEYSKLVLVNEIEKLSYDYKQ